MEILTSLNFTPESFQYDKDIIKHNIKLLEKKNTIFVIFLAIFTSLLNLDIFNTLAIYLIGTLLVAFIEMIYIQTKGEKYFGKDYNTFEIVFEEQGFCV